MEWVFVLVLLVVLIAAAALLQRKGGSRADEFPYEKVDRIVSAAERSFFGALNQAVGSRAVVLTKVRVADVLKPRRGLNRSARQSALNRITSKHFDFLICAPDTLAVVAAIELDDRSHRSTGRAARDQFLKAACEAAELPLHRVAAARSYHIGSIRALIFPTPQDEPPTRIEQRIPANPADSSTPFEAPNTLSPSTAHPAADPLGTCPKCGAALVRKVARKGEHQGKAFLACSAFPKCRYITNTAPRGRPAGEPPTKVSFSAER